MVLITGRGISDGEPLGIVTARDLLEVLIRGVSPRDYPSLIDD